MTLQGGDPTHSSPPLVEQPVALPEWSMPEVQSPPLQQEAPTLPDFNFHMPDTPEPVAELPAFSGSPPLPAAEQFNIPSFTTPNFPTTFDAPQLAAQEASQQQQMQIPQPPAFVAPAFEIPSAPVYEAPVLDLPPPPVFQAPVAPPAWDPPAPPVFEAPAWDPSAPSE